MENEVVTDSIKCIIQYSSAKALRVLLRDGMFLWIPKSLVYNYYEEYNTEDEQVLVVLLKYLIDNDVNGWS